MSVSAKPLVVMGGWLGCQRRLLNRYISVYEQLGLRVLPIIPTPIAIVEATYAPRSRERSDQMEMELIALETISAIKSIDAPVVMFHVFSNGGCFLWEYVRRILDATSLNQGSNARLRKNIRGVVFDSCPAWFGDDASVLARALDHCSEEERSLVSRRCGPWVFKGENHQLRQLRKERNKEFFNFMKEDQLDIYQLYLFSLDDGLSDQEKISDIIRYRAINLRGPISSRSWSASAHCAHLMKHEKEYIEEIRDFVKCALRQARL